MADLGELGFDKGLYRGGSPADSLRSSATVSSSIDDGVPSNQVFSGSFDEKLFSKKTSFSDATDGIIFGLDGDSGYKWYVGTDVAGADWNVTAAGTFTVNGAINADSGTIGGLLIDADGLSTAATGQRIEITSDGLNAYDGVNSDPLLAINTVAASKILLIRKADNTLSTEPFFILDSSTDTQETMLVNCGGGAATKDGFVLQKSGSTTRRHLLHLEMYPSASPSSTLTDILRVSVTTNCVNSNGIHVVQDAGTTNVGLCLLEATGGSVGTGVLIAKNDTASNCPAGFFQNGSSANDHTIYSSSADGAKTPLALNQGIATSTNFYRMTHLMANTSTVLIDIWIANNANPNGTLSGSAGDICLSSDGNLYRCTGTTNWTAT